MCGGARTCLVGGAAVLVDAAAECADEGGVAANDAGAGEVAGAEERGDAWHLRARRGLG